MNSASFLLRDVMH